MTFARFPTILIIIFCSLNIHYANAFSLTGKLKKIHHECNALFQKSDIPGLLKCARSLEEESIRQNNYEGRAFACYFFAVAYSVQADYYKGIEEIERGIVYVKKTKNRGLYADMLIHKGNNHEYLGDLNKAMKLYFEALKISEQEEYENGICASYMNIGLFYQYGENYKKAISYVKKALSLTEKEDSRDFESSCCNNLAVCYYYQENLDSALYFYERALNIFETNNDPVGISTALMNIAGIYSEKGEMDEAIPLMEKSIELKKKAGQKDGISRAYGNLGLMYFELGNRQKGIDLNHRALQIAREIDDADLIVSSAKNLSEIYFKTGDFKRAYEYQHLRYQYSDSLFNRNNVAKLAQQETQYSFEKKMFADSLEQVEKDKIQKLKTEKAALQHSEEQKRLWLYITLMIVVLGFVVLLAINFYRTNLARKKANVIISKQKEEVELQKEIVEEKHKEITDSINYAQRIQTAMLFSDETWKSNFADHFIFFRPRDIVSGDFYWATSVEKTNGTSNQKSEYLAWCVADCTGHGVPGALMSMLGLSFLNEIINEKKITEPAIVLNAVREKIIQSLKNTSGGIQQKDGMDISLCVLNKQTRIMEYAGANNPIWIIRKNTSEVMEFKADKMPVGSYNDVLAPFTAKQIQLYPGDRIFNFSDGYADQFGGEKGKKFKNTQFKALLLQTVHLPLSEQQKQIEKRFYEWKTNFQQVDDICITGIEIG